MRVQTTCTSRLPERSESFMAAKQPSEQKLKASKAQSIADRTGKDVELARDMQSRADQSDIIKHGQ